MEEKTGYVTTEFVEWAWNEWETRRKSACSDAVLVRPKQGEWRKQELCGVVLIHPVQRKKKHHHHRHPPHVLVFINAYNNIISHVHVHVHVHHLHLFPFLPSTPILNQLTLPPSVIPIREWVLSFFFTTLSDPPPLIPFYSVFRS